MHTKSTVTHGQSALVGPEEWALNHVAEAVEYVLPALRETAAEREALQTWVQTLRQRVPKDETPGPLQLRQLGVLERPGARLSYRDISADLYISESSVRTHVHNIIGTLGVESSAAAVMYATRRGWIQWSAASPYVTALALVPPRPRADGGASSLPASARR